MQVYWENNFAMATFRGILKEFCKMLQKNYFVDKMFQKNYFVEHLGVATSGTCYVSAACSQKAITWKTGAELLSLYK